MLLKSLPSGGLFLFCVAAATVLRQAQQPCDSPPVWVCRAVALRQPMGRIAEWHGFTEKILEQTVTFSA